MADMTPIHGELQTRIMGALWRTGEGTVEQVRAALPARNRGAYTTVQTVLNRLAERGMLEREKQGKGFVYRPRVSESDYISGSIQRTLAGASNEARQVALAQLIGRMDGSELSELRRMARAIEPKRKDRKAK